MEITNRGAMWRIWDLQVQTILDDQYLELRSYYHELKDRNPNKWNEFTSLVGGEENALLFDSKSYVFDNRLPKQERYRNYARNLFNYISIYKPNLGLLAFTDHNYFDDLLIDILYEYGSKAMCKCICGVEVNASGVHMLVLFEKAPFRKSTFSAGIKTFLDQIVVNTPKEQGVLTVSPKSVSEVIAIAEGEGAVCIFPHCNSDNGLFQERPRTDKTYLSKIFNSSACIFLQSRSKKGVVATTDFVMQRRKLLHSNFLFSISNDSRCLKDIGGSDEDGNFTWVKADCQFNGLKQLLIETDRVYIGEVPDLLVRVKANPTKFIDSISIQKKVESNLTDVWFENFKLELNSGLVAIIGNKGAGKSAITDILALCGNTHQDPKNFSFLTPEKFRKAKPINLSAHFEASILWKDGSVAKVNLDKNPDPHSPERVRYIPQHFLEKLCTTVDIEDFEKEIKQIIYSHTALEYRLGKTSLDELIDFKSSMVNEELNELRSSLSKINSAIVLLEERATEEYRISLENAILLKKNELEALRKNKPTKPSDEESANSSETAKRISIIRENLLRVEKEVEEILKARAGDVLGRQQVELAKQYFESLSNQLESIHDKQGGLIAVIESYNIELRDIFSFTLNLEPIEKLLSTLESQILEKQFLLDENNPEGKRFFLNTARAEIKELQDKLDAPAKAHQKYLDDLTSWENREKRLIGRVNLDGSLASLEHQLTYVSGHLVEELNKMYSEREVFVRRIFGKKAELIEIRKSLFKPVSDFIDEFPELKKRYDVRINVSVESKSFLDIFLAFINQGRIGSFQGKDDGYKRALDLLENADFNSADGYVAFVNRVIEHLKIDKRFENQEGISVESQLRKGISVESLYDFLFQLDYLNPVYQLNLGLKTLMELSPGERGALLLIFYLILDKDDIPLLIDQPEENLDNESVYHILVHFIKQVKNQRQIIIVTHNPNLAIVCDAEQVIHMHINKQEFNKVTVVSGSIENDKINKSAIDILEGTLPAFSNRDSKYLKSESGLSMDIKKVQSKEQMESGSA